MISIDVFDSRSCGMSDDCEMSLLEKLRESYHGRYRDPRAGALSDRVGTAFFWFITVTEIYVGVQYVVPQQFAEYSEWTRYCIKVFCWFVFVQTTANWACIRHCEASYHVNADQPISPATFWQSVSTVDPKVEMNGCSTLSRSIKQQAVAQQEYDCFRDNGSADCRRSADVSPISWKWCKMCQRDQPPRCHHCITCRHCILKRDHHCYITGVCIGLTNQRHFVIMNFYIAIASAGGLYFIAMYLADNFVPHAELSDYVLPVMAYRWAFSANWIRTHHVLMIIHMYSLWWIGFSAIGFFVWHMAIISVGKTTHEVRTGAKLRCTATVAENLRSVFGALWLLNFIFPAHIAFKQTSDGVHWENIKPSTAYNLWQKFNKV